MLAGLQEITGVELQPCLDRTQRQSFPQIQGGPQMTGSAVRSISGSAVQGELNVRITRQRAGPHPSSSRLSQGFTTTTYVVVEREAVEGQTCLAHKLQPRPQWLTLASPGVGATSGATHYSFPSSSFLFPTSCFNLHPSRFMSASHRVSPPPTPEGICALRRIHSGGSTTGS
jgi:hypothetical protein